MLDICRICLGEIDNDRYVSLNDHGKAVQVKRELSFCLPEIVLDLVKSPVVCELCVTRLHMMYTFHNKCIRTENIIKNYIQSNKLDAGSVSLIDLHKGKEKELRVETPQQTENPILMPTQLFNPDDDFIDDLNNALDKILDNDQGDNFANINMSLVKTEMEETEPRIDYSIVKEEPNFDIPMDIADPENMFESPSSQPEAMSSVTLPLLEKEPPLGGTSDAGDKIMDDPLGLDTSEGVFTCDICYKVFTVRYHLTEHVKTHEKVYACNKCNFTTGFEYSYNIHLRSHDLDESK